MLATDFERFEKSVRKLEELYSKKVSDDVVQAYWRALKDLPIELVEERIASHIRYAKFFPKPMELRPKEERPKEKDSGWNDAKREFDRRASETLDGLWHSNREEWLRQVSGKVHELGRAKGMPEGQIAQKLHGYVPQ